MPRSAPVDGFALTYDDHHPNEASAPHPEVGSSGTAGSRTGADVATVVLLHGWPGDRHDFRALVPLLADRMRVVVPDLRGFGDSDRQIADADQYYSRDAQARSIAGLIRELGLDRPVVAGYDAGSGIAQALVKAEPDLVGALAVAPPMPGAGERVLTTRIAPEMWYQYLHRSPLPEAMDGRRELVHTHLHYIWEHWSGPDFTVDGPEFETLVDAYSRPGAFVSSIQWYRVGEGYFARNAAERAPAADDRLTTSVRVLWPEFDPLFPREWADRLDEFFADVTVTSVDGVGHFSPLEAPPAFADLIDQAFAAT